MEKLKILLGDLRHHTIGVHSNYLPIGIGYITTYLLKNIPSQSFEVKIVTNPDEALDLIDEWKPNILAFSSYVWNSNLSYRVCEYAKEKSEKTLCVLGGPEFPSGTGMSSFSEVVKKNCFDYLDNKICIDYYCYSDGETSLTSVVEEYIKCNFSTLLMKKKNVIASGAMNLSYDRKNLLIGKPIPRLGLSNKVDGRDCIPSPYLTGLMDKFLNGKYIPSFETARGCPFTCTFCDQGIDKTKMVSFSTRRMTEELDYVAERVTKFSGTKAIAIHDSNWGMYKKDIDLSDHILKLINEKNWPSYIDMSTPKNKRQQILDIDKKLKGRVKIILAQQSMNRDTLKLIERENLTNNEYILFVRELEKRNKVSGCELIVPLPNETKESYFDSTRVLLDAGVSVETYTLMMLQGADLGRDVAINKYGMKSKWRILPRDFGNYRGKKTFDVERVCVATNTMSYEDYLSCRRFSFLIHFYSYSIFSPLRKLLRKDLNISFFQFIWSVFQTLESNNDNKHNVDSINKMTKIYFDFSKESEQELFDSKKDIFEFYSKDENYKKLLSSELGDNLLRKYAAKIVCGCMNEVIDFSINSISSVIPSNAESRVEIKSILESLRLWLNNLYIFDGIFNMELEKDNKSVILLEYDIPEWHSSDKNNVFNFKKKTKYEMVYNKRNEILSNELISRYGKDDKIFAVGKYFHSMNISDDDIKRSSVKISVN